MALYKNHFYHGSLRKYVIAFGDMFNNIEVVRYTDPAKRDVEDHRVKVPIAYGPKEKFVTRLIQDPEIGKRPAVVAPRIGFEMTGLGADTSRKRSNELKYHGNIQGETDKKLYMFTEVPYAFNFALYVLAKSVDEASQVSEQILPLFNPDFTQTVKLIPELGLAPNCQTSLDSVSFEDSYDGDFKQRRAVIWTFQFTMLGYLYGPIRESGVIKNVQTNIYNDFNGNKLVQINGTPFIDGVPLEDIGPEDDYGYSVEITEF